MPLQCKNALLQGEWMQSVAPADLLPQRQKKTNFNFDLFILSLLG
jgi:hypothetical protein